MISEEEIRSLIVCRIIAANGSCNSHHISHVEGQIRGMIAVLTGEAPPSFHGEVTDMCAAAGIPVEKNGDGTVGFPREWLESHGFTLKGDYISHPRFSKGW